LHPKRQLANKQAEEKGKQSSNRQNKKQGNLLHLNNNKKVKFSMCLIN
jgi:hypothetical protein